MRGDAKNLAGKPAHGFLRCLKQASESVEVAYEAPLSGRMDVIIIQ